MIQVNLLSRAAKHAQQFQKPSLSMWCSSLQWENIETFMQFQIKWNVKQLNTIHYQFSFFSDKVISLSPWYLWHRGGVEFIWHCRDQHDEGWPKAKSSKGKGCWGCHKEMSSEKNDKRVKKRTITKWSLEMKEKCM